MATKKNKPGDAPGISGIDLQEVIRLLEFMNQHGLEEFEYHSGGIHVRLKKTAAAQASFHPFPAHPAAHAATPPPTGGAAAAPQPAAGPEVEAAGLHLIKSPIVGTYYESATPGAEPLVRIGAQVKPGQALCIIEAMKLMNEIEADVAGEVVQILAKNGQPVEYGEALFAIRAASQGSRPEPPG